VLDRLQLGRAALRRAGALTLTRRLECGTRLVAASGAALGVDRLALLLEGLLEAGEPGLIETQLGLHVRHEHVGHARIEVQVLDQALELELLTFLVEELLGRLACLWQRDRPKAPVAVRALVLDENAFPIEAPRLGELCLETRERRALLQFQLLVADCDLSGHECTPFRDSLFGPNTCYEQRARSRTIVRQ